MNRSENIRMNSEGLVYDPSRPSDWTPEKHQRFYEALGEYITALLNAELDAGQRKESSSFSDMSYKEITLEGVVFPPQKVGWLPDYNEKLQDIEFITFSSCKFYNENVVIDYPAKLLSFNDCTFYSLWRPDFNIGFHQDEPLFYNCVFEDGVIISSGVPDQFRVIFFGCKINFLYVENYNQRSILVENMGRESIRTLSIRDSRIKRPLTLSGSCLDEVELIGCTFAARVDFSGCLVERLKVSSSAFESICDFSEAVVKSLCNSGVDYADFVLFESCLLGATEPGLEEESVSFSQVTFHKAANFRDAVFGQRLDLRNSVFLQTPNFLGSTFSEKGGQQTDRETFRIIKQAFIAVGNQIEADRFYTYEMQSYHSELRNTGSGQWRERILLGFNNVISNHGQSYLRAAGWLMLCVLAIAVVLANDTNQWISTAFPGPRWWQLMRDALNGFALGFLPLSGLYAGREHLAFFIMLTTFTLSAVSWHLLVAIRRHRRR